LCVCIIVATAVIASAGESATYLIQIRDMNAHRVVVRATVPGGGTELRMATSRPADIPEVGDPGWPALVRNLTVTDAAGKRVTVTPAGAKGWTLSRPAAGPLTLSYEVDYAPLAARDWPAPREAACADASHLIIIGRALFIVTNAQETSEVRFVLPDGWTPVLPWPARDGARQTAMVASSDDLQENLLAFVKGTPDVLSAGGFHLRVVVMGHWRPAREDVLRVLDVATQRLVDFIGFTGRGDYLVVLLPQLDRGGESFRASFAMNYAQAPGASNRADWGNTVAHEVFHYWNGWRLVGADYAATQWFQEGFTEYAANLALVSGELVTPAQFRDRLGRHVTQYRQLATPLDAPGTRKGPPLYSGGALVAFVWDIQLRDATGGQSGIGDVLRILLHDTDNGARPYAWPDILAALKSLDPNDDWDGFYNRYIHAQEPLPLDDAFARVGLKIVADRDGTAVVTDAADASQGARALFAAVAASGR
jgi:predicted metalloprotease with PDZ domain